ncbi:MAG: phosphate ABC transporter permease PstA [Candidatus Polarisedimenticolaceae bacterium]|nr:phosphate ABC transporter permease PstA [Candidatus Polarisedimenticolaceae bacterium]
MADRPITTLDKVNASLARRYAKERRFRRAGLMAIATGLLFVLLLFTSIISNGYSAFWQTHVKLDITFNAEQLGIGDARDFETLSSADYAALIRTSLKKIFPEVRDRKERRKLYKMISTGAPLLLREILISDPTLVGSHHAIWLPADDDIDMLVKGQIDRTQPEDARRLNNQVIGWVDRLTENGVVEQQFNTTFFTAGDSREPELAGIGGAITGSLYALLVTLLLAFPIGVATAIYLEEFAPKNRWTDLIEININNLAAVPSIVFGLLGLALFINIVGLPRSAPLVGGLVLTLMTLPTIIIASRAALKSVPPSIREAAMGIGASKMQTVFHHVLPQALPGMLTGTIIGMAQALGETAPLLMIGMVAFVVDIPGGPLDPSTALPVQIFLWADSPERAFVERTSAAIMVLLAFLISMNLLAVLLRKKFERRW